MRKDQAKGWRGPSGPRDPALGGYEWRVTLRTYWRDQRLPCARCGRMIDYDGPYLIIKDGQQRRVNRRSLVIGHIVDRYQAKRLGWSITEMNSITNTQPECWDCSNRSGARLGQKVRSRSTASLASNVDQW